VFRTLVVSLALALSAGAAPIDSPPTYVGAAVCAPCHTAAHAKWSGSRHSKMVQPATPTSVRGDFAHAPVQLRGSLYKLARRKDAYYITETYLTGKPKEHRVDYTLGNRRIQHYLTTLPGGRVIVLPPSWDVQRKQWFHNLDIGDPDETSETMVQIWNKNCYSCHVSQQQKNFDPASTEYKTAWLDFGTNCERCHGPGSIHVANYSAPGPHNKSATDIVLQTRLDSPRNTQVCAQCHSFRDIYVQGYAAGANYYDYFAPILEADQPLDKDPAYWPDGRTRRFSNDAFGLWQSECFLKGKATCLSCHNSPHETEIERNPQLRPDANALCTQCHAQFTGAALTTHTHHPAASTGSSCVECHMPRTVFSIKAEIRDHSMSIPVPENTVHHGIPNACNQCHKNRDAQWALANMNRWYKPDSRQKLIRRADTFVAARAGNPAAIPALIELLSTPSEGPLVRANAASYLGRFPQDTQAQSALEKSLTDPEPLIRSMAALRIGNKAAVPSLIPALTDPIATVRLASSVALVGMGVVRLPGSEGDHFEDAKQLFRARAQLNSDDPQQDLAAARFFLLTGDPSSAADSLKTGIALDPQIEAQYLLGLAYARQGKFPEAREVLQSIKPADAEYEKARRLLEAVEQQHP
jgi:predicted CXXCH cytochrome family protein